jgi:hypothetical protein
VSLKLYYKNGIKNTDWNAIRSETLFPDDKSNVGYEIEIR